MNCKCNNPVKTRAEQKRGTCSACFVASFEKKTPVQKLADVLLETLKAMPNEPAPPIESDRVIVFDKLEPTKLRGIIGTRASVWVADKHYSLPPVKPGVETYWWDGREFEVTGVTSEGFIRT